MQGASNPPRQTVTVLLLPVGLQQISPVQHLIGEVALQTWLRVRQVCAPAVLATIVMITGVDHATVAALLRKRRRSQAPASPRSGAGSLTLCWRP